MPVDDEDRSSHTLSLVLSSKANTPFMLPSPLMLSEDVLLNEDTPAVRLSVKQSCTGNVSISGVTRYAWDCYVVDDSGDRRIADDDDGMPQVNDKDFIRRKKNSASDTNSTLTLIMPVSHGHYLRRLALGTSTRHTGEDVVVSCHDGLTVRMQHASDYALVMTRVDNAIEVRREYVGTQFLWNALGFSELHYVDSDDYVNSDTRAKMLTTNKSPDIVPSPARIVQQAQRQDQRSKEQQAVLNRYNSERNALERQQEEQQHEHSREVLSLRHEYEQERKDRTRDFQHELESLREEEKEALAEFQREQRRLRTEMEELRRDFLREEQEYNRDYQNDVRELVDDYRESVRDFQRERDEMDRMYREEIRQIHQNT